MANIATINNRIKRSIKKAYEEILNTLINNEHINNLTNDSANEIKAIIIQELEDDGCFEIQNFIINVWGEIKFILDNDKNNSQFIFLCKKILKDYNNLNLTNETAIIIKMASEFCKAVTEIINTIIVKKIIRFPFVYSNNEINEGTVKIIKAELEKYINPDKNNIFTDITNIEIKNNIGFNETEVLENEDKTLIYNKVKTDNNIDNNTYNYYNIRRCWLLKNKFFSNIKEINFFSENEENEENITTWRIDLTKNLTEITEITEIKTDNSQNNNYIGDYISWINNKNEGYFFAYFDPEVNYLNEYVKIEDKLLHIFMKIFDTFNEFLKFSNTPGHNYNNYYETELKRYFYAEALEHYRTRSIDEKTSIKFNYKYSKPISDDIITNGTRNRLNGLGGTLNNFDIIQLSKIRNNTKEYCADEIQAEYSLIKNNNDTLRLEIYINAIEHPELLEWAKKGENNYINSFMRLMKIFAADYKETKAIKTTEIDAETGENIAVYKSTNPYEYFTRLDEDFKNAIKKELQRQNFDFIKIYITSIKNNEISEEKKEEIVEKINAKDFIVDDITSDSNNSSTKIVIKIEVDNKGLENLGTEVKGNCYIKNHFITHKLMDNLVSNPVSSLLVSKNLHMDSIDFSSAFDDREYSVACCVKSNEDKYKVIDGNFDNKNLATNNITKLFKDNKGFFIDLTQYDSWPEAMRYIKFRTTSFKENEENINSFKPCKEYIFPINRVEKEVVKEIEYRLKRKNDNNTTYILDNETLQILKNIIDDNGKTIKGRFKIEDNKVVIPSYEGETTGRYKPIFENGNIKYVDEKNKKYFTFTKEENGETTIEIKGDDESTFKIKNLNLNVSVKDNFYIEIDGDFDVEKIVKKYEKKHAYLELYDNVSDLIDNLNNYFLNTDYQDFYVVITGFYQCGITDNSVIGDKFFKLNEV